MRRSVILTKKQELRVPRKRGLRKIFDFQGGSDRKMEKTK
jgi:hypothetical protein